MYKAPYRICISQVKYCIVCILVQVTYIEQIVFRPTHIMFKVIHGDKTLLISLVQTGLLSNKEIKF